MKRTRLNIDAYDLALLFGKNDRTGFRILHKIRETCKKKRGDPVTTADVAFALQMDQAILDKYFFGE